jgi:anti-sigma B factor antagonist
VVDLADLRFIDSTGLSALVHGSRHARTLGRPYRVACLQPTVAKLFEITSLHEIIPVYDPVNDACSVPASQVS